MAVNLEVKPARTIKLYRVEVRGGSAMQQTKSYVLATDPAAAYQAVREYLNRKDLGFYEERELKSLELLAESAVDFPDCGTRLLAEAAIVFSYQAPPATS